MLNVEKHQGLKHGVDKARRERESGYEQWKGSKYSFEIWPIIKTASKGILTVEILEE